MEGLFQKLLLLLCALLASTQAQCPVTNCFGCRPPGSITERVTCLSAGLTSFPQLPLEIQQTVEELNLRSNSIPFITASDLQNYASLATLDISQNTLTSIEPGSFSASPALEELILAGNRLTTLPDDLFANNQLRTLDLCDNDLQTISASTFTGLQELATILLSNNLLRTIPEDTFSALGIIERLAFDGNPLTCDCLLRWLPGFLAGSSVPLITTAGTCNSPLALNSSEVSTLSDEDFICECTPACVNGTCDTSVGECACNDGYIGEDCSAACPVDTYGADCLQTCSCVPANEAFPCDNVDGACHCLPGYTGGSCESECDEGFYGQDCAEVCVCQNGASCHFITGFCNCTVGFIGMFCNMICPPLRFGQDCVQVCTCLTGNCDHITGVCTCPVGFFGLTCDHNCTEALECVGIGREPCSLQTPQQTCGPCLAGFVGEGGDGNSECILCSGAPDCIALNREPCSDVANTCGACFERHLGEEGFSNQPCFDPCIDGVMNFDETDVDCGGALCPSCQLGDVCSADVDCGARGVCLGEYVHPSTLDYPFDTRNINTCVNDVAPGNAILERFRNALLGRANPLQDADSFSDRATLQQSVAQELILQFNIENQLESIEITDLDQAEGDPLFQTDIELADSTTQESVEQSFEEMVENIHNGRLKGTLLLNREQRKALFNF